jgi:hypothetical protein
MLKALAAQPAEELDYPGVKGVLLFVVEAGKERLKLGFDPSFHGAAPGLLFR